MKIKSWLRRSLLANVHPEDKETLATLVGRLARGEPIDGEFRLVRPDGTRWVQALSDRRPDHQHGWIRISGIFKDITARKEAERDADAQRQELAHMSRVLMLGELSGAIAHELNQPLTAILANAQAAQMMLDRESPDVEEALAALAEIVEDDNRAGQVIQRLRGLLKKDQSRWELIDVNDVVRSTHALIKSEMVNRRIDSTLELATDLDPVNGDPVQLQQVVLNLMVNAMDALGENHPSDRKIIVRTQSAAPAGVEVAVIDNGTGIAPADEPRLLQPFFTTKTHGLGLGLSICSSILRNHGGSFTLAAGALGGAVAVVSLPSARMREAAE